MFRTLTAVLLLAGACSAPQKRPASTPTPPETVEADAAAPRAVAAASVTEEEDPFAGGADMLEVKEEDASSSLRAKPRMRRLAADEVTVKIVQLDDGDYPTCRVTANVLATARSKVGHFKLIGRGRVYRFAAEGGIDGPAARSRLGLCYYPPGTRLLLGITGVDRAARVFHVSTVRR